MKVTKASTYTLELSADDYEQLIMALDFAYDHVDSMGPTRPTTYFARLQTELEDNR